jgi:hypothetical protein
VTSAPDLSARGAPPHRSAFAFRKAAFANRPIAKLGLAKKTPNRTLQGRRSNLNCGFIKELIE